MATVSLTAIRDVLRAQRSLLIAGALLVATFVFGSCWDAHRVAYADGQIKELELETAAAQRERHAASLATLAAQHALALARARADSLEHAAAAAEAHSARLGQLVRVMSETTLVVQTTPSAPVSTVSVPHVVTMYIASLVATIASKDSALAARDTQLVRTDTVVVAQARQVAADSTVVTTQDATVQAEKAAKPRFGFKAGVAAGIAATVVIIKTAAALLK